MQHIQVQPKQPMATISPIDNSNRSSNLDRDDESSSNRASLQYRNNGDAIEVILAQNVDKVEDTYRTTPAYDINLALYSPKELLSDLLISKHNNLLVRGKRILMEDRYITYCNNPFAKLATISSFLIILLTLVITFWQLINDAHIEYVTPDGKKVESLTTTASWFSWVKLGMSGVATAFIAWSAFKRSTKVKHTAALNAKTLEPVGAIHRRQDATRHLSQLWKK